ncbi:MAG: class I SAM-dependent methyltransferase [Acetobacteraceae bacterium]|nr:class I SAM-dependent methyltransferase [Acetobacteraceae bacterium]
MDPLPDYDVLDIGCSSGGSLAWSARHLGGRGLGIDTDAAKVAKARAAGHQAMVADARRLAWPDGSFRCALFFDMLEHLPGPGPARECVAEAYRVSREFVLIRGPNFDGEDALRERGVKRYYADWSGHSWHHRAADLVRLIRAVGPLSWLVVAHRQITDFADPDLLPLSAPSNSGRYDPTRHAPKPTGPLGLKVFSRIVAVLAKSPAVNLHELALLASGSALYGPDADAPRAPEDTPPRDPATD